MEDLELRARANAIVPPPSPAAVSQMAPPAMSRKPVATEMETAPSATLDQLALLVGFVAFIVTLLEFGHPVDEVLTGVWVALNLYGVATQILLRNGELGLGVTRGFALIMSFALLLHLWNTNNAHGDAVAVFGFLFALLVQWAPIVYTLGRREDVARKLALKRREDVEWGECEVEQEEQDDAITKEEIEQVVLAADLMDALAREKS